MWSTNIWMFLIMFLVWIVKKFLKEEMLTSYTEKWSILNNFELFLSKNKDLFLISTDPTTYLQLATDGTQTWLCLLCGKQSSNLFSGKRHVKFVHMKESEDIVCPVCQKRFGRKQHLDRHMKSLHSEQYNEDTAYYQ